MRGFSHERDHKTDWLFSGYRACDVRLIFRDASLAALNFYPYFSAGAGRRGGGYTGWLSGGVF